MSHHFRLLVFDFDGTLVDSQRVIVRAMTEAFEADGRPAPDPAEVRRVVGLTLEVAVARLLPDAEDWSAAVRVADGYRDAFVELRRNSDYHEPLFPGARETLALLDRPEVCLGIATGKGRRGLMDGLERHGLARHFATLQTADDGPGKPHPSMLHRAMEEVGAGPHETVLIGDTTFDMEMAANAGTTSIGVAWGYHDTGDLTAAGAARVIERFDELPGELAALGRAPA